MPFKKKRSSIFLRNILLFPLFIFHFVPYSESKAQETIPTSSIIEKIILRESKTEKNIRSELFSQFIRETSQVDGQIAASIAKVFVKISADTLADGTGFFITNNLLVTNYHVVRNTLINEPIIIHTITGEDFGSILATDPENDLAIIQVEKRIYQYLPIGNSTDINRGDTVYAIGLPNTLSVASLKLYIALSTQSKIRNTPFLRESPYYFIESFPNQKLRAVSEGIVSSKVGGEFLATTTFATPGDSGSPIISEDNMVVGIVFSSASDPRNFNYQKQPTTLAISIDKVRVLIENHPTLKSDIEASGVHIGQRSLSKDYNFYQDIKTPEDMYFMSTFITLNKGLLIQSSPLLYKFINYSGNIAIRWGIRKHSQHSSFYWLEKAAKQGHPDAQYTLGQRYYFGFDKSIKMDKEKAFYWYNKAARQGIIEAQYFVGQMYGVGYQGVTKDLEYSFYWTQQAAEKGMVEARILLAIMYRFGKGVRKSPTTAFNIYSLIISENSLEPNILFKPILEYASENLTIPELRILQEDFDKINQEIQNIDYKVK